MSETAIIGYGTKVRIGRGDDPAWTTLAGVGDLDLPDGEADEVEVTAQDSPNRTKEYISGMIDNGTVDIPVKYIPDSDQDVLLRELRASGEIVQLEITPPGGGAEVYASFVKSYKRSLPVKDKASATLTMRINGVVDTTTTTEG